MGKLQYPRIVRMSTLKLRLGLKRSHFRVAPRKKQIIEAPERRTSTPSPSNLMLVVVCIEQSKIKTKLRQRDTLQNGISVRGPTMKSCCSLPALAC